jgi:hypothetical protein
MSGERPDYIDVEFRRLDDQGRPLGEFSRESKATAESSDNRKRHILEPKFIFDSYQEELAYYVAERQQELIDAENGRPIRSLFVPSSAEPSS